MKCAHCRKVGYMQSGFDRAQCLACSGYTKTDGTPTVPTCALEVGATYDGVGKELIADPTSAPWPAKPWED